MKKIIYIKVAKTGGTSILNIFHDKIFKIPHYKNKNEVIDNRNIEELDFLYIPNFEWMEYYLKKNNNLFDNSIIICSIRDPVSRYISGCNHFNCDVNKLIYNLPTKEELNMWIHITQSYSEYIKNIKIDYFIRTEKLIEDIQKFCNKFKHCDSRFNIKIENIVLNKKNYINKITNKTIIKVTNVFKNDIKLFNNTNEINDKFLQSTI